MERVKKFNKGLIKLLKLSTEGFITAFPHSSAFEQHLCDTGKPSLCSLKNTTRDKTCLPLPPHPTADTEDNT